MRQLAQSVRITILGLASLAVLTWVPSLHSQTEPPASVKSSARPELSVDSPAQTRLKASYAQLPLSFEENRGQTDDQVRFLSRGNGYTLFLTRDEAVLALSSRRHPRADGSLSPNSRSLGSSVVRLKLAGANQHGRVEGVEALPGRTNYFIGSDPKKWRRNVPTYAKVKYKDMYPGIDVVYYGNQSGQLEYDFVVAPGADPKAITLNVSQFAPSSRSSFVGALRLDANGDLIVRAIGGGIRFRKPSVYQKDNDGNRHQIDGHYLFEATRSGSENQESKISFELAPYDRSKPLIIDPAITYSTYLSGTSTSAGSIGNSIATFTDPVSGNVYAYVAGVTCDPTFPTVNARQSVLGAGCSSYPTTANAFVAKFDPSVSGAASVIYSTYLGGANGDAAAAIAIDSAGNAYIAGVTNSTNFPVANAYQAALKSSAGGNAFLTKLSADGSELLYSTYFGGSRSDHASAIALDSTGRAYIAGVTASTDFPTLNPYQSTLRDSAGTVFAAAFDTTRSGAASLIYSTYLGGSSCPGCADIASGVAVDGAGTIHLVGRTTSNSFPIANGFQTVPTTPASQQGAAFYARLNPSATAAAQLLYSTYLGGWNDTIGAIALDSSGNAYLAGTTGSQSFPTTPGAFQSGSASGGFVTKINSSLAGANSLLYSTLFPGPAAGIAVDASGDAFVVGSARQGIPLVNPVQGSSNGVTESLDAGQTWTALTQGLSDIPFPITSMAIDTSTSPRTLYVGTETAFNAPAPIFASVDGGLNWKQVFQVSNAAQGQAWCFGASEVGGTYANCISALAVDPLNPSNVYAGTSFGVFKSSDRGSSWSAFNTGLSNIAAGGIWALLFDVSAPDEETLYAGALDGLYKLNAGATSWVRTPLGVDVQSIALDPTTTPYHTIYTGTGTDLYNSASSKSTDGGNSWTSIYAPPCGFTCDFASFGVDTTTEPATIYGYVIDAAPYLQKSTDGGNTWNTLSIQDEEGDDLLTCQGCFDTILVDTKSTPAVVYVNDLNGVFKSSDGGTTWKTILATSIGAIALDPTAASGTTPSTLYAATQSPVFNAFVAEVDPSGSSLLFSTYLGSLGSNASGNAIALDASENIYVTGGVICPSFIPCSFQLPTVNAFQSSAVAGTRPAFFTKLGSQTLPQTASGNVSTQVGVQTGALTVTLPNISGSTTSSAPTLTVTPLSSAQTANFSLSNNLGAYDISTTASFSGSVTLCFQALTVNDPATFNNLELFHIVNGTPTDVTSSRDFSTRTVCGTATSLSPFVLFSPTTSTALGSSLNPSTYSQQVTFTATAAASGGTPVGTVTFYDGSTPLGTETLNSAGQATLNVAGLSVGTHTITAAYSGGGRLNASTSSGFIETVNKASTSTVLSTSTNSSVLNQSITFTATVSAMVPANATPTGTVTFKDGAAVIGTATLNSNGQTTLTISSLAVGSHSISAVYSGDSNFTGGTSAPSPQQVHYESAGTTCDGAPGHQILQPISADGTSVWKQGRTIPAQFRVCDANGVSVGTPGVVVSFVLSQIVSGTITSVDETVSSTNADSAFHWDSANQQWIFNIGTKSLAANNTYVYTITLNDGTTIGFQYGLK